MHLGPLLRQDLTLILTGCADRHAALEQIAQRVAPGLPGIEAQGLLTDLLARENEYPTSTREGVAFPHVLLPGVEETVVSVGLLRPGVRWSKQESTPQDLVFVMIGPDSKPWQHVRLLARLARISTSQGALERLRAATTAEDLFERLVAEDNAHA